MSVTTRSEYDRKLLRIYYAGSNGRREESKQLRSSSNGSGYSPAHAPVRRMAGPAVIDTADFDREVRVTIAECVTERGAVPSVADVASRIAA